MLIDNTGVWRGKKDLSQHLNCKGINKVLLTAPGKEGITNIVYGINNDSITEKDEILGAASCTTNAIVPVLKVLNDEYNSTGDLNNDGIINILDLVSLVNIVLGGRTIHTSDVIGTSSNIYLGESIVAISANGPIAGIQMTVIANYLELNENLPMNVEFRSEGNQHVILVYGLHGEILSGNKVQLFTSSDDYEIISAIVSNILSEAMEIELTDRILPDVFELSQNFPNPFNPNTQIQFVLGKDELVSLNIFDIQGRLVSSLINNSNYPAGYHNITWDGTNTMGTQVPSGMYLYKLVSENQTITRKMVLMK